MLAMDQNLIQIIWAEPRAVLPGNVVGGFCFNAPSPWSSAPVANLDMPVLGSSDTACSELLCVPESIVYMEAGNIRFTLSESFIFGICTLEDSVGSGLESLTASAYAEIFQLLLELGFPEVWRFWNHFPDINSEESGLERYRQFNIGRQRAFDAAIHLMKGRMPAASAVGVRSGPLTIAFLAGHSSPVLIENPAQVSAYEYPDTYGPQSPSFSRAAVVAIGSKKLMLVSGTASIQGHVTINPGDAFKQTKTALENIRLVSETAEARCGFGINLSALYYRAYVRDPDDYQEVHNAISETLGAQADVHYVQADICRRDLLVEIEATGYAR